MAHKSKVLAVPGPPERAESSQAKALRARLARNELTPEDERRLRHTQAILDGRAAGKSMQQIAEEVGEARTSFSQFARGGIYRVLAEHLTALEVSEDESVADENVRKTRTALKSMSGHVKEYVAWAARKRQDGKGYEDEGAAMWAAQYLSKANGLDSAERASRPTINVHIDTIQAVTSDIKRDLGAALGGVVAAAEKAAEDVLELENGA